MTAQQSLKVISLDARITRFDETIFRLDMQSQKLQKIKLKALETTERELNDLIRENDYFRQKIVYYKEFRNVMLKFHSQTRETSLLLQSAIKELSDKMTKSEEAMLSYWDIKLNDINENDLVAL